MRVLAIAHLLKVKSVGDEHHPVNLQAEVSCGGPAGETNGGRATSQF